MIRNRLPATNRSTRDAGLNGLRRLSLQAMEQGWSDEEERRMACAAGWLPTGELGQALCKLRPVRAFAPRLF